MPSDSQTMSDFVHRELTGDDGGTYLACVQCEAREAFDEAGGECPACKGGGRVWREDEVGRGRIGKALYHWRVKIHELYLFRPKHLPGPARQWAWDNREGQPWQAALESAVAAYREPAPLYDESLSRMGELLGMVHGWSTIAFAEVTSDLWCQKIKDWPAAVLKAVYEELGGESNGQ